MEEEDSAGHLDSSFDRGWDRCQWRTPQFWNPWIAMCPYKGLAPCAVISLKKKDQIKKKTVRNKHVSNF